MLPLPYIRLCLPIFKGIHKTIGRPVGTPGINLALKLCYDLGSISIVKNQEKSNYHMGFDVLKVMVISPSTARMCCADVKKIHIKVLFSSIRRVRTAKPLVLIWDPGVGECKDDSVKFLVLQLNLVMQFCSIHPK